MQDNHRKKIDGHWSPSLSQEAFLYCSMGEMFGHWVPLSSSSRKKSILLQWHSSTFKGSLLLKINVPEGGQPGAALPLRAATSLHSVAVSCRLGEPELAPQSPPLGRSLSQKCYRKHTLFILPINTVTVLLFGVTCSLGGLSHTFLWIILLLLFLFFFLLFLVCYCCELNIWHPPYFPRLSPNNCVDIFPHNASNSSFKS